MKLLLSSVKERIEQPDCKPRFLLDGFPRTQPHKKKPKP